MQNRLKRKTKEGIVSSTKMNKTVVVDVGRSFVHKLYKKVIKRVDKFSAHDEENKCVVGNKVRIVETRPISRTKKWRVEKVIA